MCFTAVMASSSKAHHSPTRRKKVTKGREGALEKTHSIVGKAAGM